MSEHTHVGVGSSGSAAAEFEIERLRRACAEKDAEIVRLRTELGNDQDAYATNIHKALDAVEAAEARATAAEQERDNAHGAAAIRCGDLAAKLAAAEHKRNAAQLMAEHCVQELAAAERREAEKDKALREIAERARHTLQDVAVYKMAMAALASPSTPSPAPSAEGDVCRALAPEERCGLRRGHRGDHESVGGHLLWANEDEAQQPPSPGAQAETPTGQWYCPKCETPRLVYTRRDGPTCGSCGYLHYRRSLAPGPAPKEPRP